MGDKKENYFLLMRHEKQAKRMEEIFAQQSVKNLPIANPNFLKNLRKSVAMLAQKNRIIEEF